jgi:hypothetical protein
VDAALAEVDLTEVILHNVDLDAVAAHLNVDAIIKTVDINSIVATVDLNAAIHRVDVNAIVKRIDLNGAVAMVDLNTIVNRLDINEIADEHRPWPVARRPSRDPGMTSVSDIPCPFRTVPAVQNRATATYTDGMTHPTRRIHGCCSRDLSESRG